ncbi:hypothetical protein E0K89_014580 [Aquicoccus sp. SCR17]|nr:hypothetical protein [Carideicomes alvinocaridis]
MTQYRPGDIIEITTDKGLAYVHLTHDHESYPPVIRLLKGLHAERPADLARFASEAARTTAMIPIETALERLGLAHEKAGYLELPQMERSFPTFRMPVRDKQGEIVYWWFWDGQGLSYASELDETQKDLPLRDVMSSGRFLEELLSGV